jgi:hypothetical protein
MKTISQQAAAISAESAKCLPAAAAHVFAEDRRRWSERGEPDGIIRERDQIDDFALPDATGSVVTLGELVANGPAVIVFYRGGWCP